MKRNILVVHFTVPLLAFLFLAKGAEGMFGLEGLLLVAVNYVFFALPHFAWLVVARTMNLRPAFWHAGLFGANVALVALLVTFECCVNNANALGWFYYYPVALVLIVGSVLVVSVAGGDRENQA